MPVTSNETIAIDPCSMDCEQQTAGRIASGDPAALESWFLEHQDGLYAFVYYRVGKDPDLAADATQATFLKALSRLDEFDPIRGGMATWLRWLARNVIRSMLTPHQRGVQLQMVWDRIDQDLLRALGGIDREALPEDVLQREETRELVGMTLANLPPPYQELLSAKYCGEQSLAEIAQQRDCTVDSVKSMLRRARAAFRDCFLTLASAEVSDV